MYQRISQVMISGSIGLLFALPAMAEPDIAWGEELHAGNCVECHMVTHDDAFYEARIDGDIDNYGSLFTMVQACANNFNLPWFDDEIDAVSAYLDQTYYQFDE